MLQSPYSQRCGNSLWRSCPPPIRTYSRDVGYSKTPCPPAYSHVQVKLKAQATPFSSPVARLCALSLVARDLAMAGGLLKFFAVDLELGKGTCIPGSKPSAPGSAVQVPSSVGTGECQTLRFWQ